MKQFLTKRDIRLKPMITLIKCYVFSILLHGVDTRTIKNWRQLICGFTVVFCVYCVPTTILIVIKRFFVDLKNTGIFRLRTESATCAHMRHKKYRTLQRFCKVKCIARENDEVELVHFLMPYDLRCAVNEFRSGAATIDRAENIRRHWSRKKIFN